jgi:hypothetical protein
VRDLAGGEHPDFGRSGAEGNAVNPPGKDALRPGGSDSLVGSDDARAVVIRSQAKEGKKEKYLSKHF